MIHIKKILSFSIPIGLAGLVGTISIEVDKLMIGNFLDTEMLAIYSNAGRELPFDLIAASFTAVLLPQMAKMLKENRRQEAIALWKNVVEFNYILVCFVVMGFIVFAPQVMSILYSNKYLPGVNVFRVYCAVGLLRITYWGIVLNSTGKTKVIFYCSLASMVLNVGLNFLFFKLFGFIGPAIATLVSILAVSLFQLSCSAKITQTPMAAIFPWKNLLKVCLVNAGFAAVLLGVSQLLHLGVDIRSDMTAVLIGVLASIAYFLLYRRRIFQIWSDMNHA